MTTLRELRDEAAACTRCNLYERATQTVFGEGRAAASIMLLGEQPGDQEDKQGRLVVPLGAVAGEALFGRAGRPWRCLSETSGA